MSASPRRDFAAASVTVLLAFASLAGVLSQRRLVGMTRVAGADKIGAVCLDGSLPAYHLDRGFGSGASNWLLQFEGGGWCNDIASCSERAKTQRGSTVYMRKFESFSGILSSNISENPDFYNWNRVKLRYCDGGSFTGNSQHHNGTTTLYFRGQRIWYAIILDLLSKGLNTARKALLSGCSAGGLATFHHCDNLKTFLPKNATLKCLSDAGFFLDIRDISGNSTMRSFFQSLVALQEIKPNLNVNCTRTLIQPYLCFFPQYSLSFIRTPYFILNSAYDVFQFHHIFVPPSADPRGYWNRCKLDPAACTPHQLASLQVLRYKMLVALTVQRGSSTGGLYINSCFAHCQSELQDTWLAPNSPTMYNKGVAYLHFAVLKTIAMAVGDWYLSRRVSKEVDCPFPCDKTCHNLIP